MTTHRWLTWWLVVVSTPTLAHLEPARTLWERAEQQRARERTVKARHKTCVNWTYTVTAGKVGTERAKSTVMDFDRAGNLTGVTAFRDDVETERATYTWSARGDLEREVDATGAKVETTTFRFDAEGRVVSGETTVDGKQTEAFVFVPTKDRRRLEFIKRAPPNQDQYRLRLDYAGSFDEADFTTATKIMAGAKEPAQRVEQVSGKTGVERKRVFNGGKLAFELQLTNGPHGRPARATRLVNGVVESKTVWGFDAFGNITDVSTSNASDELVAFSKNECELYPLVPLKVTLSPEPVEQRVLGPGQTAGFRSGRVVLTAGQAMHRHSTGQNEEVLVLLGGKVRVVLSDIPMELEEGQVLYLPPQTEHEVHNDGPGEARYLYLVAPAR